MHLLWYTDSRSSLLLDRHQESGPFSAEGGQPPQHGRYLHIISVVAGQHVTTYLFISIEAIESTSARSSLHFGGPVVPELGKHLAQSIRSRAPVDVRVKDVDGMVKWKLGELQW